jgi:pimeloyl-ACP methyl ester carboxylesterase
LYLHGFASGPASGKAQWFRRAFIERGVDLEIPDLVEGDFENLTISGQLAVIERVAQGEAISLIGSSMGGYLAALYALRHPEVKRLVLLAPAFHFPQRWPEELGRGTSSRLATHGTTGSLPLRREPSAIRRLAADRGRPAALKPSRRFHNRL